MKNDSKDPLKSYKDTVVQFYNAYLTPKLSYGQKKITSFEEIGDINKRYGVHQETLLMIAASHDEVYFIVKYLVALGADKNLTNTMGQTALDYAQYTRNEEARIAMEEALKEARKGQNSSKVLPPMIGAVFCGGIAAITLGIANEYTKDNIGAAIGIIIATMVLGAFIGIAMKEVPNLPKPSIFGPNAIEMTDARKEK